MSQMREVKLYPTPANCQCEGPDVPYRTFMSYLDGLVAGLCGDEQATVVVSGAGNLDIRYQTKISDYALALERIEAIKQALAGASRDGLTPEEVAKLQQLIG